MGADNKIHHGEGENPADAVVSLEVILNELSFFGKPRRRGGEPWPCARREFAQRKPRWRGGDPEGTGVSGSLRWEAPQTRRSASINKERTFEHCFVLKLKDRRRAESPSNQKLLPQVSSRSPKTQNFKKNSAEPTTESGTRVRKGRNDSAPKGRKDTKKPKNWGSAGTAANRPQMGRPAARNASASENSNLNDDKMLTYRV